VGAYFNQNPDKIVSYPFTWFGKAVTITKMDDMYPKTWHKITD